MKLTVANAQAIRYACMKFHYAKAVPVNVFGINVYNDAGEWCGVVLYGTGANNNIGNEFKLPQGQCVELVRAALNGKQSCTSQVVAASLKFLKAHCPLVRLVVSYSDCDQNHWGTIYQATNWLYVGTSMQDKHDSSWIVHGKRYHGRIISDWVKDHGGLKGLTREQFIHKYYDPNAKPFVTKGKRKYLMPLDKKIRKQVASMAKPYPKDRRWEKLSREEYAQKTQQRIGANART